jgi:hypothetical protein
MKTGILSGLAAGAAGTTAINAATYADMAWRGRPASNTPEETIDALVSRTPLTVPGSRAQRGNRISGLAGLSGIATGIGVGVLFGVLRRLGVRPSLPAGAVLAAVTAMAATDVPMARMKVSNPATWSAKDWLSDAIPHLVYGATTYAALRLVEHRDA